MLAIFVKQNFLLKAQRLTVHHKPLDSPNLCYSFPQAFCTPFYILVSAPLLCPSPAHGDVGESAVIVDGPLSVAEVADVEEGEMVINVAVQVPVRVH